MVQKVKVQRLSPARRRRWKVAPFQCPGDCAADAQQLSFQQRMPSSSFQFETCLPTSPRKKLCRNGFAAGFSRKVGLKSLLVNFFHKNWQFFQFSLESFKFRKEKSQHQKNLAREKINSGVSDLKVTRLKPTLGDFPKPWMILLMEEIPNNHLGCIPNPVNNGINCQPQLVSRISSINSTFGFLESHTFGVVFRLGRPRRFQSAGRAWLQNGALRMENPNHATATGKTLRCLDLLKRLEMLIPTLKLTFRAL